MTRKDYRAFAEIFSDLKVETKDSRYVIGRDQMMVRMARIFKADNPAFRPVQFFIAAGHTSDEAGHLAELV